MNKYLKTVVAVATAALVSAQSAVSDGVVTTSEWINITLVAIGAFGVWFVENAPSTDAGRHERA